VFSSVDLEYRGGGIRRSVGKGHLGGVKLGLPMVMIRCSLVWRDCFSLGRVVLGVFLDG